MRTKDKLFWFIEVELLVAVPSILFLPEPINWIVWAMLEFTGIQSYIIYKRFIP